MDKDAAQTTHSFDQAEAEMLQRLEKMGPEKARQLFTKMVVIIMQSANDKDLQMIMMLAHYGLITATGKLADIEDENTANGKN